ncbi:MAG TPA: hypothetical protein VHQ21_01570 [Rhodanobacteraceae bacterium]|jgi:hypothetical protein|nr:hypothetical protein [Rhodanobacteraceae bacterium]
MKRKNLSSLLLALAILPLGSAFAAPTTCGVSLTQEPLVLRIGKDEFRIAFGLDAATCHENGCSGSIRYDATWQTDDGQRSTERKTVAFDIPAGAERSLSVDRHYFDTAEAQHTTQIVGVAVEQISCDGADRSSLASR